MNILSFEKRVMMIVRFIQESESFFFDALEDYDEFVLTNNSEVYVSPMPSKHDPSFNKL